MTDIQKYADEAVALRRAIHKRPEEGWTEFETMYRVVTTLEKLGYALARRCSGAARATIREKMP